MFSIQVRTLMFHQALTWPGQVSDHLGGLALPEHAHCTLGGVKVNRAHFVGGGRHNLLQHLLMSLNTKSSVFTVVRVRLRPTQ